MFASCQPASVGCIFQWKIQNINHCWLQKGERLDSPPFIADALEGTKWTLRLYPMGYRDQDGVGFFLHRDVDCSGPDSIDVSFEFSFLGKDGSFLKAKNVPEHNFQRNRSWGLVNCESRKNVIFTKKELLQAEIQTEDSITVKCTIWDTEEEPDHFKCLLARTVFKEDRKFFKWEVGKLSDLQFNIMRIFQDELIDFDLTLSEKSDFGKTLMIKMNSLSESIKYFAVKSSYENFEEKKEICGFCEYLNDNLRIGKLCSLPFNNWLQRNKSRYCIIKCFFIDCEYVVRITNAFYGSGWYGLFSPGYSNTSVGTKNEESVTTEILKDLKCMYDDGILSDIELCTSTKSFPAHKAILSARSPVFRCMFSNNMKERQSGQVEINDFEEDTVHRMLLYMYTDSIEDLQFESASKLYTIADKYQILSLKNRCSSFLKDNLSSTKACEILFLADKLLDNSLKSFAQDYILEHAKEIFVSQEWKDLMKDNPKLAADLMYRKMYPE